VKASGILRLAFAVLLAFGTCAPAAPVPKELKVRPDAERMQGLWKEGVTNSHWLFKGDKLFAGGTATPDTNGYGYSLTMNADVSPPEFNLGGTKSFAGIYKFVGDDLHVAYCAGAVRPTDFTPGPNKHIHVLKRISEVKK
jgi:uncharacterized protein (TIGR03067 family)